MTANMEKDGIWSYNRAADRYEPYWAETDNFGNHVILLGQGYRTLRDWEKVGIPSECRTHRYVSFQEANHVAAKLNEIYFAQGELASREAWFTDAMPMAHR